MENASKPTGMSQYEFIHGRPNTDGKKAREEMSRRFHDNLETLEKERPGTKKMYDDLWKLCSPELAEKFCMVRAMIERPDWFKHHSKHILPEIFKDGYTDVLAEIVRWMKNKVDSKQDFDIIKVKHFVQTMQPHLFPDGTAEEHKMLTIKVFNSIDDMDNNTIESSLGLVLEMSLCRIVELRVVSDPAVFEVNGVNPRNADEVRMLMSNTDRMLELIEKFPEERELVNDVRRFMTLRGNENVFDFNSTDFIELNSNDTEHPNSLTISW